MPCCITCYLLISELRLSNIVNPNYAADQDLHCFKNDLHYIMPLPCSVLLFTLANLSAGIIQFRINNVWSLDFCILPMRGKVSQKKVAWYAYSVLYDKPSSPWQWFPSQNFRQFKLDLARHHQDYCHPVELLVNTTFGQRWTSIDVVPSLILCRFWFVYQIEIH